MGGVDVLLLNENMYSQAIRDTLALCTVQVRSVLQLMYEDHKGSRGAGAVKGWAAGAGAGGGREHVAAVSGHAMLDRADLTCKTDLTNGNAPAQALREGRLRGAALAADERMRRPGLGTLVLDEADLMLVMPGYADDLRALAPLVRQVLGRMRTVPVCGHRRPARRPPAGCAALGAAVRCQTGSLLRQ